MFIVFIILYIISLELTCVITRNLYLVTAFIQFALFSYLASGNHKSDLFFYEFVSEV